MVGRGKRIRFSKLSLATGQVGGYPDLHEILSPKTKPKAKQNMGKKTQTNKPATSNGKEIHCINCKWYLHYHIGMTMYK